MPPHTTDATSADQSSVNDNETNFVFTPENFRNPSIPSGLNVLDVPLVLATPSSLLGYGYILDSPDDYTTEKGNFEIVPWPRPQGARPLDPHTGAEAGTTEGDFEVGWKGDYFFGKNLAVNTINNTYLDGLGAMPEIATQDESSATSDGSCIYLWMSDFHPDGGQLFFPKSPIPFCVCLGKNTCGDNVKPEDMQAFYIPAGKGVYFHPGTWHNGVYVSKELGPQVFFNTAG